MVTTISPSQAKAEILHNASRNLVTCIKSSPGLGKSSIVAEVAREFRLKLIDIRLSQCTPEDLNGFPMRNGDKATFVPFDIFPLQGEPLPVDDDGEQLEGWLIFFDEITSASKPVQAAAYKVILDKMVGSFKLHDQVVMVAAGNKSTDRAVVTQMSTALQSRMINYEMDPNVQDWVNWAFSAGIDTRIISYVSYMPSQLMDFRPDHQEANFPCPRTWEFLSRMIKDEDVSHSHLARVAGAIGEGAATQFITFAKEFDRLPKLSDILANPDTHLIPSELSTKYATMIMLVEHTDKTNISQILKYVDRFAVEMRILFMRGCVALKPELQLEAPEFMKTATALARYLA